MAISLLISALAAFLSYGSAAQTSVKKPITKKGLLEAIRLNGLSTEELVDRINQRGVNFQMTGQDEGEFRAAGARPELIVAVKSNYRPEAAGPTTATPSRPGATSPGRSTAGVPAGPPLAKNEIITLLQSGVPPSRVEQFVEARGVSFSVTPEITREIMAAGGNRSLLGAITEKSNDSSSISSPPSRPGAPAATGPDYDDLTEQATAAILAANPALAVQYSQQAIRMDPAQPTAYQLLGFAHLYGYADALTAERSYRLAIERGGSGVFRVYHDHDGVFQQYCQGSMFVTRGGVTFKADDGNHTFAAQDAELKEAKMNALVGASYAAFHLKVARPGEKKSQNYNFAPYSTKQVESRLIINLIQSF
jgi:hypothetical protein